MTRQEMEARRLSAIPDLQQNIATGTPIMAAISRKYDVSQQTVMVWRRILRQGQSLRATIATGRPRRLDPDSLRAIYEAGPHAFGFSADRWSIPEFASAIEQRCGIRYDHDHLGRLMHKHTPWKGRRKEARVAA